MKIAYTIKETAEALGCGMNTTYNLVNSGQLKSFKFGKKIMIPVQSIEEIIKDKAKTLRTLKNNSKKNT